LPLGFCLLGVDRARSRPYQWGVSVYHRPAIERIGWPVAADCGRPRVEEPQHRRPSRGVPQPRADGTEEGAGPVRGDGPIVLQALDLRSSLTTVAVTGSSPTGQTPVIVTVRRQSCCVRFALKTEKTPDRPGSCRLRGTVRRSQRPQDATTTTRTMESRPGRIRGPEDGSGDRDGGRHIPATLT
jgi:hypothetical protein